MTDIKKEIGYRLNSDVMNPKRCSMCQYFYWRLIRNEDILDRKCGKHNFAVAFFGCCDDFEKEDD